MTGPNLGFAFSRAAADAGDALAITFAEGHELTYAELDEFSNRVASFLSDAGLRKGDRIAHQLDKCPTAYLLMLGALKLGVAYVAVDPRSPALRTGAILAQCRPRLYFAAAGSEHPDRVEVVECASGARVPAFCEGRSAEAPRGAHLIDAGTPAYVMFTSGSTGTPKGAVISHDNVLHFIDWTQSEWGFAPGEVHAGLNPLHFDNSVFDFYTTLFSGGTLVPFELPTLQEPMVLTARLVATGCSTWYSVPSLLMFLQATKTATVETLGALKRIIFAGEGYPKHRLKQLFDVVGDRVEIHNAYGPTETTCLCSNYPVSATDFADLEGYAPIGEIAPTCSHELLDEDGRPVPEGEIGELYLGGPCMGLGYFDRPDLTAAAFVQNPRHSSYRDVLYRSGDLMRRDPADGKLHFAGRRDLQIKHMGHRIELEEVQHVLAAHPEVDEAIVLHAAEGDRSELVAVVASAQGLDLDALRTHTAERLPAYMRPGRIHVLPGLPKNANGKTDRRALADEYASPRRR